MTLQVAILADKTRFAYMNIAASFTALFQICTKEPAMAFHPQARMKPNNLGGCAWGSKLPVALIAGMLGTIGFAVALGIVAWHLKAGSRPVNFLVVLFGSVGGWAAGIMASPYSAAESVQFSGMVKAVSAFVTGYVISKVDRVLEALAAGEMLRDVDHAGPLAVRLVLFLTAFILAAVTVFVGRRYAFRHGYSTEAAIVAANTRDAGIAPSIAAGNTAEESGRGSEQSSPPDEKAPVLQQA